jgi:hypothetical protein
MSINLPNLAVIEFDAMVKAVYQSEGFLLRNTCYTKSNVVGSQVRFQKVSKGMASLHVPQNKIPLMDIDYTPVTATMQDWDAADMSDIFKQREVNFEERQQLAKMGAMAIGRRCDQIIIDAVAASGTGNIVAAGGTGFDYAKFLSMNKIFSDLGVTRAEDRFVILTAEGEEDILNDDKFINSRYTNNMLLGDGRLDGRKVMGYNWIVIPSNAEGGLTAGKAYAWAKNAMGFAVGMDIRADMQYLADYASWFVNTMFKGTAVAIDNTGIVEVSYT